MNTINYAKELERIINKIGPGNKPKLLIHSCCAPCSSYCLIYLLPYFDITCFFFNPNITDRDEYEKRLSMMYVLSDRINEGFADELKGSVIDVKEGDYCPDAFIEAAKSEGLEKEPEGGRRCGMCFSMRLKETYEYAKNNGFDYFTTTLTISPHKNAKAINDIGYALAKETTPLWLPSDFKKNDGFKRSIELSKEYGLYRQDYCGCCYTERQ